MVFARTLRLPPSHNLPGQQGHNVGCRQRCWGHEQINKEQREQNGDRVIDTGFDLEGGGDPRPQLETAKMQQRGDCRRVDRRNNRTD
jgi:hypothetical protein